MHQQSRHPPRMTSPASSPQTNPTRTNNPREAVSAATRARAGSEALAQSGPPSGDGGEASGSGPSRESIKKLDQIIQVRKLPGHPGELGHWGSPLLELSLQGCSAHTTIANKRNTFRRPRVGRQEDQQMGESSFRPQSSGQCIVWANH
jgi:hypothetical protein